MASTFTLLQIGDLHLAPGHPERLEALDRIIAAGEQVRDLGAWLIPGDLNHGRMAIDDRNALAIRLQQMALKAPVVIVRGNHDVPGDLDIFAALRTQERVLVVTAPDTFSLGLATGHALCLCCLPYPTKAGLIAAGTNGGATLEAAGAALTDVMRGFGADIAEARADFLPVAFIGHVNVGGSVASTGQPQIGTEIELTGADLALLGPSVYVGLNHIHKHQRIHGAVYAGSVAPCDWAETEPKGYLLVRFAQEFGSDTGAWLPEVEFVELPNPTRWHVDGEYAADGSFTWRATSGPEGFDPHAVDVTGDDVRVRYRFPASLRALINLDVIRAPFLGAARLDLEAVAVPDSQLRAPQVAAAPTLLEKLQAWAELNGQDLPASMVEKLAQLATLERSLADAGGAR